MSKLRQWVGRCDLRRALEVPLGLAQVAAEMQAHPPERGISGCQSWIQLQRTLERLSGCRISRFADARVVEKDRVVRVGKAGVGHCVIWLLGNRELVLF